MEVKNKFDLRLRELKMVNFRQFEELTVPFHRQLTVLVGKNRSGKTTVLDALASLLQFLVSKIKKEQPDGKGLLAESDLRNGAYQVASTFRVSLENGGESMEGEENGKKQEGSQKETILTCHAAFMLEGYEPEAATGQPDWSEFEAIISAIDKQLKRDEPASLPVLAYYRCDHATDSFGSPQNGAPERSGTNPYHGYDKALAIQSFDFRQFFEWYKWRERIAIQTGEDRLKNNVEEAIIRLLSDDDIRYENLHADYLKVQEGELKIVKNGKEESVNQFSSGEKLLFALTANLAWRMSLLNKNVEKPLEGSGIVLIDEIDLHLHPGKQREVLPKLLDIFKNVQFIVTTHSPLILAEFDRENIRILSGSGIIEPPHSKGRDYVSLLFEFMGTPQRPDATQSKLDELYLLLEKDDFGKEEQRQAHQTIATLKAQLGTNDPDLIKAESILHVLED